MVAFFKKRTFFDSDFFDKKEHIKTCEAKNFRE